MKKQNTIISTAGTLLYLLGCSLGLFLLSITVWGDIESFTFSAEMESQLPLTSLHCPVIITRDEIGVISMTIDNPLDREVNPLVKSNITRLLSLVEEERIYVPVPPHGSRTLSWQVSRKDAAYHWLVLVRIYQFSSYALPSRQASCGIVVLPFSGLTGQQFYILTYILGAIATAVGLHLWIINRSLNDNHTNSLARALTFFGIYVFATSLLSLNATWVHNLLMIVLAVISMIVIANFATIGR